MSFDCLLEQSLFQPPTVLARLLSPAMGIIGGDFGFAD